MNDVLLTIIFIVLYAYLLISTILNMFSIIMQKAIIMLKSDYLTMLSKFSRRIISIKKANLILLMMLVIYGKVFLKLFM